jgi:hypothetical protein
MPKSFYFLVNEISSQKKKKNPINKNLSKTPSSQNQINNRKISLSISGTSKTASK